MIIIADASVHRLRKQRREVNFQIAAQRGQIQPAQNSRARRRQSTAQRGEDCRLVSVRRHIVLVFGVEHRDCVNCASVLNHHRNGRLLADTIVLAAGIFPTGKRLVIVAGLPGEPEHVNHLRRRDAELRNH